VTTLGHSTARDNFFAAQDLVVLTMEQPGDVLTMWVSRGLSDLDKVTASSTPLDPAELRFATPDGARSFEGLVHSVKVWPDRAITREEVELERFDGRFTGYPPPPVICHADFDGDGATTVFDFGIFAVNFGMPGTPSTGDLDGDGDVDVFDFAIFAADFGCIASP
jgi:hypothetical protein